MPLLGHSESCVLWLLGIPPKPILFVAIAAPHGLCELKSGVTKLVTVTHLDLDLDLESSPATDDVPVDCDLTAPLIMLAGVERKLGHVWTMVG